MNRLRPRTSRWLGIWESNASLLYRSLLLLLACCVVMSVVAPAAVAQVVGDDLTDQYHLMTGSWFARLSPIAQRMFLLFAAFEFAISAYMWGLRRQELDDALAQFILKFLLLSVLYFFLIAWIHWGPLITDSFSRAGQVASGATAVYPMDVAELGIDLQSKMLSKAWAWGLLVSTADTVAALAAGFLVVIAFGLIAVQLVIALVESYIVIGTGVFFLGFAAFRGTSSFTDRYLVYAFSVGIRLFLLYLLVGIGQSVAESWITMIDAMSVVDYKLAFRMIIGSFIFAGIVLIIPNRAARQLTDGATFGLREAVQMR